MFVIALNGADSGIAIGPEYLNSEPCSNYSQFCSGKFALMPLEKTSIHLPPTINTRLHSLSVCVGGGQAF